MGSNEHARVNARLTRDDAPGVRYGGLATLFT